MAGHYRDIPVAGLAVFYDAPTLRADQPKPNSKAGIAAALLYTYAATAGANRTAIVIWSTIGIALCE